MKNTIEKPMTEYQEEALSFLILCGDEDRNFINIPKKKRKSEEYARLICITAIFGYQKVCMMLMGESNKRMEEVVGYIAEIKNNFILFKKWIDEFIENIRIPEIKRHFSELWEKQIVKIDKENFNAGELFGVLKTNISELQTNISELQ